MNLSKTEYVPVGTTYFFYAPIVGDDYTAAKLADGMNQYTKRYADEYQTLDAFVQYLDEVKESRKNYDDVAKHIRINSRTC